ncbi:hypothetical protein IPM65_01100 [Candidatus Roizmanbacteria bacterium]|nr:MAG: hypothetical protein IPM65_01100 [Candidatus Roizmanbacteria bacterium]
MELDAILTIPSNNMTRTFLVRPEVQFTTQHEDEEVVLVVRRHILTQIPWIFNTAVFIVLVVVANFLYRRRLVNDIYWW